MSTSLDTRLRFLVEVNGKELLVAFSSNHQIEEVLTRDHKHLELPKAEMQQVREAVRAGILKMLSTFGVIDLGAAEGRLIFADDVVSVDSHEIVVLTRNVPDATLYKAALYVAEAHTPAKAMWLFSATRPPSLFELFASSTRARIAQKVISLIESERYTEPTSASNSLISTSGEEKSTPASVAVSAVVVFGIALFHVAGFVLFCGLVFVSCASP